MPEVAERMDVAVMAAPGPATLLTICQVAAILDCSPRTVYRLVDAGRVPAPHRLGSLLRWNPVVIQTWIAEGCPPCRKPSG
ncbi:MAG: helix-turn-helix domain-containing protein [Planctomycetota bacterium]|nr:helix-turn-helix domain-containing protein [Planctomycetota bacterium]